MSATTALDPYDELKLALAKASKAEFRELPFQPRVADATLRLPAFTPSDLLAFFSDSVGVDVGDYLPAALVSVLGNVTITSEEEAVRRVDGQGHDDNDGLRLTKLSGSDFELRFALQYTGSIDLADVVSVSNFYVAFTITRHSFAAVLSSGSIRFLDFDLQLQVAYDIPARFLTVSLHSDHAPNGEDSNSALVQRFLGSVKNSPVGAIEIEEIELLGELRQQNYILHLSVTNLLDIHDKIAVKRFQTDISIRRRDGRTLLSILAYTELEIGLREHSLGIALTAERVQEADKTLWRFAGSATHSVSVGDMIDDLCHLFTAGDNPYHLPAFVADTQLDFLALSFELVSGAPKRELDFTFTLGLVIPVGERVVRLEVYACYHKIGGAYQLVLSGSLLLDGFALAVAFSKSTDNKTSDTTLLASLQTPLKLDSTYLIRALSPSLADDLPISVDIELLALLLAMHSGGEVGKQAQRDYLFRLSFNLDIGLGGLPLIGKMLEDVRFTDGQLLAANRNWQRDLIDGSTGINSLLGIVGPPSPLPIATPQQPDATVAVSKGITLSGTFQLTEEVGFPLFLQFGGAKEQKRLADKTDGKNGATAGTPPAATSKTDAGVAQPAAGKESQADERSQSKIDKVISAVRIKKVALTFEDGRIGLKITGGLALAAFEFELMGMQVTVPQSVLDDPSKLSEIAFSLDGFGAEIRKGTLSIMGAFLRQHHEERNDTGKLVAYDEFSGIIQVAFPPFSLTGMGAYAMYQGHPSLFLFVALGFPISVHPALLIEGMALGFGIHRDFIPPQLDAILTYPLVAVSVTPPPPIDIAQMAESMHQYFPPAAGLYFVVVGVKFKAFGLVDSLVLVAVKFGRSLEINLIGVSSILFPSAFLELAWMARFVPESGYLFIGGQLTERSFLLIPQVQLTGGFAVAAWLCGEHKGDFVVSVGGYHPHFHVPAHYPDHIPRLGISFHLGSADIKGGMYFAITPQCVMMGGLLEASIKQGGLSAFIRMALDAIIYFAPFHYDVLIGADAGVKVDVPLELTTMHLDMHLHLDVHIWGPEFSGTALLDVGPKTFDLAIGAAASIQALPISYQAFKEKFLPTVCTVSVTQGLLRKAEEGGVEIYVVDGEKVVVEARSTVPITVGSDARLGITPMDVRGTAFHAKFALRGDDRFKSDEVLDAVPTGIWGGVGLQAPDLSDAASGLVRDVLTGYRLTPGAERKTSESHAIEKEKLAFKTDTFTLKDRAVSFQMVAHGDAAALEAPVDSYYQYTGMIASDIRQVDAHVLMQPQLLTYALA